MPQCISEGIPGIGASFHSVSHKNVGPQRYRARPHSEGTGQREREGREWVWGAWFGNGWVWFGTIGYRVRPDFFAILNFPSHNTAI